MDKSTESCINAKHMVAHYEGLKSGLAALLEEEIFCDITLASKSQRFNCHKVILCAFSSFFRSMFTLEMKESSQKEVQLDIIEPIVLQKVLDFMYKGETHFTTDDIYLLLPAATYLQIAALQRVCEKALLETTKLSTVLELWTLSTEIYPQLHMLRESCENFMLERYGSYFHEEDFLQNLTAKQVSFLAGHEDICVPSELHLVNAFLVKWFQYDFANREQYLLQVFENVRLMMLGEDYNDKEFPFKDHPSLQPLMQEMDRYFSNPGQQIHFNSLRAQPRVFDVHKKALIVMGKFDNFYPHPTDDIWSYDMPVGKEKHGEWTRLETLPLTLGTGYQTCVSSASSIIVTGGRNSSAYMSYDGIENKWNVYEQLPASQIRWNHCMTVVQRSLYILGGKTKSLHKTSQGEIDKYTVSRIDFNSMQGQNTTWETCGELLNPVFDAACLTSGSNIILFDTGEESDMFQCFDTQTNTCSKIVTSMRFSSQVFVDGNYSDAYLMSGDKIYCIQTESEHKNISFLDNIYTCQENLCKKVSGIVKNGTILYIIGTFVTNKDKTLSRGVMNFDLVNRCIVPEMEEFKKHPFLPSGQCKCHFLVVKKKFHTDREIDQYVKFTTNQLF